MTIQEKIGVSPVSVGELLKFNLSIPPYQRPYSWIPAMALQLMDDLTDAKTKRANIPYVLGAVILHECGDTRNVVDGQQRILTLHMILAILRSNQLFTPDEKNETPVIKVWRELKRELAGLKDSEKAALLKFITDNCQVVCVITNDEDEAFRVFDSQNYRGKPLAPHDLLKAYHLREMQDESAAMKVALVEAWESVPDTDLDSFFPRFSIELSAGRVAKVRRGFPLTISVCSKAYRARPITNHPVSVTIWRRRPLCL